MALTAAETRGLTQLVAGMFNAAPGATYLAELAGTYEAGGRSLAVLAAALAATPAYTSLFPNFQTSDEFATGFLTPLGLQANTIALDFVRARLAAGANKGQIVYEAVTALAASSAAEFADARAVLANKTTVAEYFSVTRAVAQTSLDALRLAIAGVTRNGATVAVAQAAIDEAHAARLLFTSGVDSLGGTAGDDFFVGTSPSTVSALDQVFGGSGNDTLKLYGVATLPGLSGIETLWLNAPGASLDVSAAADVTRLVLENEASARVHTLAAHQNVSLRNTAGDVSFLLPAADAAIEFALDNVQTGTGVLLALQGPALASVTFTTGVNASKLSLRNSASSTVTTAVTASGEAALELNLRTFDMTGAVTIDASRMSGAFTVTPANAGVAVTGGSGNDRVIFQAGEFTAADVVDGGSGTDVVQLADTAFTDAGAAAVLGLNATRNVETLALAAAGVTLDASLIPAAISTVRLDAGAGSYGFTSLGASRTVEVNAVTLGANNLSLGMQVGNSVANLKLGASASAAASVAQLVVTGASTVNIDSAFGGTGTQPAANSVVLAANGDNTNFIIRGAQAVSLSGVKAATTGSVLDGSNATGKLTLTASGKSDIVKGGAGADTLITSGGNDTVTGNGGADTFLFQGGDAVVAGAANLITITDFTAGVDKFGIKQGANLFLDGLNVGAATVALSALPAIASAADVAAVYGAISGVDASTATVIQARLVTVTSGAAAGTYLFVNDDSAASAVSEDLLVKLTGTLGTLSAADFVLYS